jgi:hypothetical protein
VIEVYEEVLRKREQHALAKRPPFADVASVLRRRDGNEARDTVEAKNEG